MMPRAALARIPVTGLDGLPLPDSAPAVPTVYGILVYHGVTGVVGLGYVGKTFQRLRERIEQHQADQPFGDVIVAAFVIEQCADWDDVKLSARETFHIRAQRPWHNIVDNRANLDRIMPWDAIEHRQAREPGWQPPAKGVRIPRQRVVQPLAGRSTLARWWGRRRWWVAGLAAVWLALFAAGLRGSWLLWGDVKPVAAAVGSSAPFVLVQGEIWRRRVRAWWRRSTRPKRRSSRRGRR